MARFFETSWVLAGALFWTSAAAAADAANSALAPVLAPAAPEPATSEAAPAPPEEAAEPADAPAPARAAPARAAPAPAPELPRDSEPPFDDEVTPLPPAEPREWYGLPMVILDGLWLGAIALGRAADSNETIILGTVGGITNGLFVHLYAYDSSFAGLGIGLLSVTLRGGLAGGGCALGSGCRDLSDGALLRTSIGIAIGAGLDAAFLAHQPLFRRRPPAGVSVVPFLSPEAVGGSVVGRF